MGKIMKLVKLEQAYEFSNSDTCKGLEYPLYDKEINVATAIINGRYPKKRILHEWKMQRTYLCYRR